MVSWGDSPPSGGGLCGQRFHHRKDESVCGSNTADTVRTDFKALDCFISLFYLGFFCNFPYVLPVSEDLLEEI